MSNRKKFVHGAVILPTWNRVVAIKVGELTIANELMKELGAGEVAPVQAVSVLRSIRRALRRIQIDERSTIGVAIDDATYVHTFD